MLDVGSEARSIAAAATRMVSLRSRSARCLLARDRANTVTANAANASTPKAIAMIAIERGLDAALTSHASAPVSPATNTAAPTHAIPTMERLKKLMVKQRLIDQKR